MMLGDGASEIVHQVKSCCIFVFDKRLLDFLGAGSSVQNKPLPFLLARKLKLFQRNLAWEIERKKKEFDPLFIQLCLLPL